MTKQRLLLAAVGLLAAIALFQQAQLTGLRHNISFFYELHFGDTQKAVALADSCSTATRYSHASVALHYAASLGRVDLLKELLKSGMNVDTTNDWGATALLIAAGSGHSDCVRVLLANGANPEARTIDGRSPLRAAAWVGDVNTLRLLLQNTDNTPPTEQAEVLIATVVAYNEDALAFLLDRGFDPKATNEHGSSALSVATRRTQPDVLEIIHRGYSTNGPE